MADAANMLAERLDKTLAAFADSMPAQAYRELCYVLSALKMRGALEAQAKPATEMLRALGWIRPDGSLHNGCPPFGEPEGWQTVYVKDETVQIDDTCAGEAEPPATWDRAMAIVQHMLYLVRIDNEEALSRSWNELRSLHGAAPAQDQAGAEVPRAQLIAAAAQEFASDRTHLGRQVYVNDLVWALSVLAPAAPAPVTNEQAHPIVGNVGTVAPTGATDPEWRNE